MARIVSVRALPFGEADKPKPKSEILTIEEFERRVKNGTL